MQITGHDLIQQFEQFAPPSLAMPGDPIGIQIGDATKPIHTVMVTLDVRPAVVAEAIAGGVDMLFAHHPAVFHPAANLDYADPQHRMYADLIKHDILVYAAHTNYDRAQGGMNDVLAAALELQDVQPFIDHGDGANMGRIGTVAEPQALSDYVATLRRQLSLPGVRVIANDLARPVRRVAVLGGAGADWFQDAQAAGADVYVTGDVSYHVGHDLLAADLPVIDAGHHIEAVMQAAVRAQLIDWAQSLDWAVQIRESQVNTEPFRFL